MRYPDDKPPSSSVNKNTIEQSRREPTPDARRAGVEVEMEDKIGPAAAPGVKTAAAEACGNFGSDQGPTGAAAATASVSRIHVGQQGSRSGRRSRGSRVRRGLSS